LKRRPQAAAFFVRNQPQRRRAAATAVVASKQVVNKCTSNSVGQWRQFSCKKGGFIPQRIEYKRKPFHGTSLALRLPVSKEQRITFQYIQ
jgi:hypothetical protein